MQITVEVKVDAPIAKVWGAYTTPAHIEKWNFASDDWRATSAAVDLRVGGVFSSRMEAKDGSAGFDFAGTYTRIIPNELIEYSFGERTAAVSFFDEPDGVRLSITFDAEEENSAEQQQAGWSAILKNFAKHVASL